MKRFSCLSNRTTAATAERRWRLLVDADLPVYFLPFAPVSQELLRHLKEFVDVFVMPEPKSIYGSQRESIGGLYSRFTGEEEVCDIRWPSILDAGRKFIEQVGRYALESNVFIHCAHDEMSFHTSVLSAGFISLVSSDDARHRACANEFGFTVYTPRGRGVSVIQNGDIAWGSGRITFPGRPGLSTRWEGFLDHIRIEDEPGERVRPVHAYSSLHDSLVNLLPMPDEYVPKDLLARVGEIYRALERERSVLCFPRPDACGRACAFDMRTAVESAVRERGVANVVLAGGSTPKMMFKALNEPEMAGVDWRKVRFFFGDERPVGPNHERSNYRLARENLFGLGIPQENVYRIRGEADDPDAEAARYEKLVRDELGSEPRFDWVMLGMGSDAHTASLFPSSDVLEEKVRLVATGISPDGEPRVTMTYRLLNSARRVAFLVTGEHKADALGKVLEGGDMTRLPAVAVRPWGRLAYFCDKAAARRI
ncbi:MAG: 6-phosphogluconolactonase [Planctomycetota bacterium]|nr:6-phosphogluconolactonase [Planctomycetota bacterium]